MNPIYKENWSALCIMYSYRLTHPNDVCPVVSLAKGIGIERVNSYDVIG